MTTSENVSANESNISLRANPDNDVFGRLTVQNGDVTLPRELVSRNFMFMKARNLSPAKSRICLVE